MLRLLSIQCWDVLVRSAIALVKWHQEDSAVVTYHDVDLLLHFVQHRFILNCYSFQDMMSRIEDWFSRSNKIDMGETACNARARSEGI